MTIVLKPIARRCNYKQKKKTNPIRKHIINKIKPPIPVGLGMFTGNGGFATNPTGGTDLRAMRKAGYTWVALVVDPNQSPSLQWGDWRPVPRDQRPAIIPWCRCRTFADIDNLIKCALYWGSESFVINLEDEAIQNLWPKDVAKYVRERWHGPFAVITLPWVQNGAGWKALNDVGCVCIIETFMNADPKWAPGVCVQHAHDEGFTAALPCFGIGTWSDAPHDVPHAAYKALWSGPHSDYPTERMVYA